MMSLRSGRRVAGWLLMLLIVLAAVFPTASGSVARAAEQPEVTPSNGTSAAGRESSHPLDGVLAMARESLEHMRATIHDYTASLVKRERVGGKLGESQTVLVKIRQRREEDGRLIEPFSVYMRFERPKSVTGREVIWVENANQGKLVAHETGFKNLLRLRLAPTNMLAMYGQRYPITEIGIENLMVELLKKGERDRHHGECDVKVYKNAKVDGRLCTLIQVVHPEPREHFDFYRARIFIDDELGIPIRYAAWSWPTSPGGDPVLEEEYTYRNLELNVGLTDLDFDPDNPAYDYP